MISQTAANRWVVYSTFDAEGLPDPPAAEQLAAYRDAGFKTLLIDTSPILSEARRGQWESLATKWCRRENVGYDFGSYKFGIDCLIHDEKVNAESLDLVITNDSCFGPFVPFSKVFERFDRFPEDPRFVYGITDSPQKGHHLQSYWLYFRAAACHHAVSFFDSMTLANGREQAIEFGEIALGAYLRSANCKMVAYCPWDETMAAMSLSRGRLLSTVEFLLRRGLKRWKYNRDADSQCLRRLLGYPSKMEHFNPSVLFAIQIYRAGLSPFIKKSIFRENFYKSPEIPPGLKTRGMTNVDARRFLDAVRP